MFQLEVLDGGQIYACNVCDQGFDREEYIKRHIEEYHKGIIIKISKDMENKKETELNNESVDGSFEYAWLGLMNIILADS